MTTTAPATTSGDGSDAVDLDPELSPREVREIIGAERIGLRTIHRWVDRGLLPGRREPHGTRARRIPRSAAEAMREVFDERERDAGQ
jgi:hypothetical protein